MIDVNKMKNPYREECLLDMLVTFIFSVVLTLNSLERIRLESIICPSDSLDCNVHLQSNIFSSNILEFILIFMVIVSFLFTLYNYNEMKKYEKKYEIKKSLFSCMEEKDYFMCESD